jgi:bla regulator protein blaR1
MTAVSLLIKITVILSLALCAARLGRQNRAALRHLWLAAGFAGLLILPLASMVAPAVAVRVPVSLPASSEPAAEMVPVGSTDAPAVDGARTAARDSRRLSISISAVLLAGWGAGAALLLFPLAAALWQVSRLRRTALPWRQGTAMARALFPDRRRPIEVVLHDAIAGPMTCGIMRPAIVLPADVRSWPPDDLQRALLHELEHIRRADWVTQTATRALCAVYWFHPLVWIAWQQLVLEAERACDDAVVRRSDATAYADQLVLLAERISASGQPQPAMAGRHDLVTRVGAVLDARQVRGRAGFRWIAFAGGVAVLLAATISPLRVVPALAQEAKDTKQAKDTKEAEDTKDQDRFEVASIRPCRAEEAPPGPARGTAGGTNASFSPGRMNIPCVTVEQLIYLAYASYGANEDMRLANDGLGGPSNSTKVRGGPDWVHSQHDKYAVEATAPGATERTVLLGSMLRALLEERFKLKMHRDSEEVPMYALTVAKSGFKLQPMKDGECREMSPASPPDPNAATPQCGMLTMGAAGPNAVWAFYGFPISALAGRLSGSVGRHVIDRTGITDKYLFKFRFHPDEHTPGIVWADRDSDTSEEPAASIFTALEQQLGLKLESVKAPRGFLVIDHIERPTTNGGAAILRR